MGKLITTATSGASGPLAASGFPFDLVRRQRRNRSRSRRNTVRVPNAAPNKVSSWGLVSDSREEEGGLDWVVLGAKSPRWGLNPPLLRQFSFGILRLSPKSSTVSARSSSE